MAEGLYSGLHPPALPGERRFLERGASWRRFLESERPVAYPRAALSGQTRGSAVLEICHRRNHSKIVSGRKMRLTGNGSTKPLKI